MSPATLILKDGLGKALSRNFCAVGFCVLDLWEGLGIGRQRVGILEPEVPNWSGENLGDAWQAGLGCTLPGGCSPRDTGIQSFWKPSSSPWTLHWGWSHGEALASAIVERPFLFWIPMADLWAQSSANGATAI